MCLRHKTDPHYAKYPRIPVASCPGFAPPSGAGAVTAELPTALVSRYRAVDRELITAPDWVVDTPSHLDALEASIAAEGIRVPLELRFNASFGFLDGNHRLAVAHRLGLEVVPVMVIAVDDAVRASHGRPMLPEDLRILRAVSERCSDRR